MTGNRHDKDCQLLFLTRYAWNLTLTNKFRRGSRINTDRFPKRAPPSGVRGRAHPGNFLGFSP